MNEQPAKDLYGLLKKYPRTVGTVHSPPVEGWPMHFAMYVFSNHGQALHNVTPIDLLVQSAVLLSLTGWSRRVCTSAVSVHSPPLEGWQAQPDGVVVSWGC